MSITYYEGDTLYVPNVDDIENYLWKKYEDETLRQELLNTYNIKLYGNHSNTLMKFRDTLKLHFIPINIKTGKYYYFKINMGNIEIPSIKYRFKGIINIYTFEKIEEKNNVVIAKPNIKTDVTKIYDCSFGDDYTLCFSVKNNELFLITDKQDDKYIDIFNIINK